MKLQGAIKRTGTNEDFIVFVEGIEEVLTVYTYTTVLAAILGNGGEFKYALESAQIATTNMVALLSAIEEEKSNKL
jgi:hypothetical protein